MPRALFQVRPSGSNNPVVLFGQLNNIFMAPDAPRFFQRLPVFAAAESANAVEWIWFAPMVVLDDVREDGHRNLL
jgi:hypothetical protein